MSLLQRLNASPAAVCAPSQGPMQTLYRAFATVEADVDALAVAFLDEQLAGVAPHSAGLPSDPQQLMAWVEQHCVEVTDHYAQYLAERKQGAPRRYFHSKAHALDFLRAVAPTKQVDGAWLYGVLPHWQDYRYDGLLSTYLEELGDGEPLHNHVVLYRRQLAELGCDDERGLSDAHFQQGAIQLALGRCAESHLPEVLGYNLGYEQLPLHLLISAYELSELGIDPYYFTLHVTIDNASSGHARKAVQAVLELKPLQMSADAYWQRVARGFALNDLGLGSTAVIEAFDLQAALLAMLERKRPFGLHMHSNYCRFDGKTVNQWLQQPGQLPAFVQALQDKGWLKRHEDPRNSRFWNMIEGPGAAMFGVFSGYEKQLLHDWIAGDWRDTRPTPMRRPGAHASAADALPDAETQALRAALDGQGVERQMALLLPWLGPLRHCRPAGLFATRRFIELRAGWR